VLARPETATDRDYLNIEGVIAHEYFHNWTGNRITCRDWFQLSLKEGLTVFRDQEFSADMGSRGVRRIEDVRILRAHQFSEDAGPMAHPVRPASYIEINNFYTVTVYNKGAEVIRMQRNLLGAEGFRKGMDLYFRRHDGQAVTTDDFVGCMQDASGRDMDQFQRWYHQAGTPRLGVEGEYDEHDRTYTLKVEQSCPETADRSGKEPFDIPLALGLLDTKTGRDLPMTLQGETPAGTTSRVLELRQPKERYCFVGIPVRPVPSLLRGFSAPVKVNFDYSDEDLMFLMAHDSDDFNRWDAAQELAQRMILNMVAQHRDGHPMAVPRGVVEAFGTALADDSADKNLLAEVLYLPSESYLGDQMETVDVEGIHAAREAFMNCLASALKQRLIQLYREHEEGGAYDIQPDSIGRRALKNACLSYLMQLEDPAIHDLCMQQFRRARNMTDSIAALAALAGTDCPQRAQALEAYAEQWKDDTLVMDKWFAVQAMSKLPDVLHQVKALMGHPAFSITNPNKVRSLIGAFCSGNVSGFHAADGSGYDFLAGRVLEIDPLNPQVAARLVRSLTRWRRYDPERREMIKLQLRRIIEAENLSRGVFEIVSKSLAAA
jgi:aminopeptidase N